MELLIERGQRDSYVGLAGRPVFQLWAKFELTEEEHALINKYKVKNAIIYLSDGPKDVWRAIRWGCFSAFVFGNVIYERFPMAFFTAGFLTVIAAFVCSYVIYQNIRTLVTIDDIIKGRFFSEKSVMALLDREVTITEMACGFRSFLEMMKNWGGRQVVSIKPGMVPTLRLVEQNNAGI